MFKRGQKVVVTNDDVVIQGAVFGVPLLYRTGDTGTIAGCEDDNGFLVQFDDRGQALTKLAVPKRPNEPGVFWVSTEDLKLVD